jgi:hypothetical protein
MIPQIHLNFGPTALDRLYQFSLPLIPGGLFIGGVLIGHPEIGASIRHSFELSEAANLFGYAFLAYIAGFVLFAASGIVAGIVSGIVQSLVFRRWTPLRWSRSLSQCTAWRSVAASFLGNKLAPALPQTQPTTSAFEQIMASIKKLGEKQNYDAIWEEWYRILQDYLLRDVPIISNDVAFTWVALQATGWAGVALCCVDVAARHWIVYLLASTFILFGALFPFLTTLSYLSGERLTYWDFTAKLLAEVRAGEIPHKGAPNSLRPEKAEVVERSPETSLDR